MNLSKISRALSIAGLISFSSAYAAPIYWTDWTSSSGTGGFTAFGTIVTPTSTVDVTYNNPNGVAFFQPSGGTDYWRGNGSGNDPATSPYTSSAVDNIPDGTDIIALQFAGTQSLTFSEAIANPVFSFVSLNGNGYAFDQDFEILSYSDGDGNDNPVDPADGNNRGFWGTGSVTKTVVDMGGGVFEYRLIGSGEPHGTIRFTGAFSTVSWRSLANEYWNGFTVGVQGTDIEVNGPPVPEVSPILATGLSVAAMTLWRRVRRK